MSEGNKFDSGRFCAEGPTGSVAGDAAVEISSMHAKERIGALTEPVGILECASGQNCVKACPKDIPRTESLAQMDDAAWKLSLLGWLVG